LTRDEFSYGELTYIRYECVTQITNARKFYNIPTYKLIIMIRFVRYTRVAGTYNI